MKKITRTITQTVGKVVIFDSDTNTVEKLMHKCLGKLSLERFAKQVKKETGLNVVKAESVEYIDTIYSLDLADFLAYAEPVTYTSEGE